MNNINHISGYGNIPPIRQASGQAAPRQGPHPAAAGNGADQVQISSIALFLNKIAELPDIRSGKVEEIRRALADGTYDIEGKLSIALDQFLDENLV